MLEEAVKTSRTGISPRDFGFLMELPSPAGTAEEIAA